MTEQRRGDEIRRVGIIFSGGPAPAANAVISAAGLSFLEDGREVLGFFHGYSNLQHYHPITHRLLPDEHYRVFTDRDLRGIRNERGIVIGTARTNPGKGIASLAGPGRSGEDGGAAERVRGPGRSPDRRADLDRRGRHPEDGELPEVVPGRAAAGASGSRWSTSRRRSTTTTTGSTSRSGSSRRSTSWRRRC